ncbi:type VI secretion protein VasK [Pseudomonas sp. PDM18]|uniref:ImcF-related family protein n=1 Tax=Pseudomonas sp. PDM18 TaxID=2769253 RepID=UPI001783E4BF|nr:ImcF-related family protein [Pseudomonas sp. PDM18]MBD9677933.1 type VI secretion protein VasK [Pseudomonas sp. PDM18]
MRKVKIWGLIALVAIVGAAVCLLLWLRPELLGIRPGSDAQRVGWWLVSGLTLLLVTLLGGYRLVARKVGLKSYRQATADDAPAKPDRDAGKKDASTDLQELRDYLRDNFGYFWRRKVRLLLVVGEPGETGAITPALSGQQWLEGEGNVLLWGGSLQGAVNDDLLERRRTLCPSRPLDGIVWALNKEQSADPAHIGNAVRHLRKMTQALRWQAPVHVWEVCSSAWAQGQRPVEAVGCQLAPRLSRSQLASRLERLELPLREKGLAQMEQDSSHDFLLRLTRDLQSEGIARWKEALEPLLQAKNLTARGLWFSLPLRGMSSGLEHGWQVDPAWRGVLADNSLGGKPSGWTWLRGLYTAVLAGAGLCLLALLVSFTSNRAQIATVETALETIGQPGDPDAQLSALNELTREIARLDYRREHGVPWYQRFGLSQNDALLESLWPRYAQANNRLMRDVVAKELEAQLSDLAALPADSPERGERAEEAHGQLKAYLMMARPEKVDAAFLTKVLTQTEPTRAGVAPGLWQGISPNLWAFYAQHLAAHPQWRIKTQPALVAQVRQVLLGQLGRRNGVANLYQQVIEQASNNYADLTLMDMVGETDSSSLFDTPNSVPGVFTRQAWERQVSKAIDEMAETRREEIDWVLSDQQSTIDSELTPEVLKSQLTERYFRDFSDAWLTFLNSIRWRKADSLSDSISQLTLLSDVRQSPLIALMNTLAYQGRTEVKGEALADSLMRSAQQLLEKDKQPAIEQRTRAPQGPLDNTFGPLLALLGKEKGASRGDDALSLQAFLTRVTRVRLKLQHVTNASDPQAMTQALAQTVFQGTSVDLTDTLDYGGLIAASLGGEWSGFGQNLFVQPLNQAWEGVLQPSAAGLNRQWQRAVVDNWNRAFKGRYPFDSTGSDASLPMLGQMIRSGSGRIDQFIKTQLGGVLRKEGNRWVPDSTHSQGLHFNPQFLRAVNQLSDLADILYTDGGMGMSFQLQAKPVRNVVETTFILDGVKLEYFNQMESWQQFTWPGGTDHPGASLSWTSLKGGARLFGDYAGVWGLIRLLEQAQVTSLDGSDTRFELVLKAADELPLTWQLQTELGRGPLAVLQLRGFALPENIFDIGIAPELV